MRDTGSRKGDEFVCVPIGIREDGLAHARQSQRFRAYDPLNGRELKSGKMLALEKVTLPAGPGALIIIGRMGDAG